MKLPKRKSNMSEIQEDRISKLPASLLHHILSFVDTREAARTSVLSKRWQCIWRSIPILRFEYQNSSQADKFIDFVDKTLEFHDESNIQKFALHSDDRFSEPRIKRWISTVVSRNVEEFSLKLHHRDVDLIPSSLYTCESLTSLSLLSCPNICFPVSFPRLSTFNLVGAEFRDECCYDQLFSNCPVLQTLFMGYCIWYDMKSFCIANPSLKDLVIYNPEVEEDGFQNCALKIHAPMLMCLTYKGRVPKDYILSGFPMLVEATVDFFCEDYGELSEQEISSGAVVSKFLRALAQVERLTISNETLQVLSVADNLLNNLPTFRNLYKLGLSQKLTADKALIALLEKAPNLVVLEFEEFVIPFPGEVEEDDVNAVDYVGEDHNENEDNDWEPDIVAARCSLLHLKLVTFNKFTGNAREMRWVKLILKNAKALNAMVIACDPNSNMKSENVIADISSLPRASARCVFL